MVYYAQSDTPITPAEKPPEGELPPLVIWGPGDPRPTLPIAGWNPGSGNWPTPPEPPTEPPPGIWGPTDPPTSIVHGRRFLLARGTDVPAAHGGITVG